MTRRTPLDADPISAYQWSDGRVTIQIYDQPESVDQVKHGPGGRNGELHLTANEMDKLTEWWQNAK